MTIKPDHEMASPIQIDSLLSRLEDLKVSLRQSQIKQRLHLPSSNLIDEAIIKDLRHLHIKAPATADEVIATIKLIKDWRKTAPMVHLTFSVPPSMEVRRQIIDWFHEQINPQILVEFLVDGSISAGLVLRTKNKIFNFTANQVLWENRGRIRELVQSV